MAVSDDIQSFAVRVCPMFGEGDQSSVVCDAIRFAQWNICGKTLPVIGDRGSVLQLTYAGNAACGVARVLEKMIAQPTLTKEAVFVLDEAPKKDIYTVMKPVLESRNIALSSTHVPFFLVYMLYWLCCWPLLLLNKLCGLPAILSRLPSPSVLYMTFYHWTFFSPNKSRLLLDFVAPFTFDEAMRRSVVYYKSLDVASLPKSARSWRNVE